MTILFPPVDVILVVNCVRTILVNSSWNLENYSSANKPAKIQGIL